MTNEEIAATITKSVIEKTGLVWNAGTYKDSANAIAEIYKIIYKAVSEPES